MSKFQQNSCFHVKSIFLNVATELNYHQLSCHFDPLTLNYRFFIIIHYSTDFHDQTRIPVAFLLSDRNILFAHVYPLYFTIGSFRESSFVIRKRLHNSAIECKGNHMTSWNCQMNIEHGRFIGDAMFVSDAFKPQVFWYAHNLLLH